MRAIARIECMTRRRGGGGPRGPFSGVSIHLRRRYVEPPLSPYSLSMVTPLPILTLPLDSSRCLSSPASPPSKSPLFIANGFRIMMPGWLRDPIQIPRVSSSGPARFLPPPLLPAHSLSLPPPTLFVHGVVIAGGVIALARDLSNNLLCTIPPRHTTIVRLRHLSRPRGQSPLFPSHSLTLFLSG